MDFGKQPCKLNKDKDIRMATWNILSLNRSGALARLKDELNKNRTAITAVQEIRWSGREMFDSEDFVICYSRNKEKRQIRRRDNVEQDS